MKNNLLKFTAAALTILVYNSMCVYASDDTTDTVIKDFDESKLSIILDDDPVDVFVDQLDKDIYGGLYYENDIPHIAATTAENAKLIQSMLQKQRGGVPQIIVDDPSVNRSNSVVYSVNELHQAQKQLLDNRNELNIMAVGINTQENAVAVYLNDFPVFLIQ